MRTGCTTTTRPPFYDDRPTVYAGPNSRRARARIHTVCTFREDRARTHHCTPVCRVCRVIHLPRSWSSLLSCSGTIILPVYVWYTRFFGHRWPLPLVIIRYTQYAYYRNNLYEVQTILFYLYRKTSEFAKWPNNIKYFIMFVIYST